MIDNLVFFPCILQKFTAVSCPSSEVAIGCDFSERKFGSKEHQQHIAGFELEGSKGYEQLQCPLAMLGCSKSLMGDDKLKCHLHLKHSHHFDLIVHKIQSLDEMFTVNKQSEHQLQTSLLPPAIQHFTSVLPCESPPLSPPPAFVEHRHHCFGARMHPSDDVENQEDTSSSGHSHTRSPSSSSTRQLINQAEHQGIIDTFQPNERFISKTKMLVGVHTSSPC